MPELESNHKEADPQVMVHVEHTNRTYSSTIFPRGSPFKNKIL